MSGWKDASEFVPLFVAAANGGDPFAQARCVQMGWGGRTRDLQGAVRLFEAIVAAAAAAGTCGHSADQAASGPLRPPASVAALAPQVSGHRLVPGSAGHESAAPEAAALPPPQHSGSGDSAPRSERAPPASSEEGLLRGSGPTPPPAARPPQVVSSGSKRRYSSASGSTASGGDSSMGSAPAGPAVVGRAASRSPLASFSAPLAMTQLALCSRDGYGEPTSPAKAAKWAQVRLLSQPVFQLH